MLTLPGRLDSWSYTTKPRIVNGLKGKVKLVFKIVLDGEGRSAPDADWVEEKVIELLKKVEPLEVYTYKMTMVLKEGRILSGKVFGCAETKATGIIQCSFNF